MSIEAILLALVLLVAIIILIVVLKMAAVKNDQTYLLSEIARIENAVKQEIITNRRETNDQAQQARLETARSLKDFGELISSNMNSVHTFTAARLDQMRETLEKKIADMQAGNERKLDQMRATVDEKLQKTLETRLSESFKLVSERLEAVHK